jgi:hypothetical protein|tara:strand:+ start:1466 stop:1831 length:366 start_codon:yes stop_codon:yes gene_type:complete
LNTKDTSNLSINGQGGGRYQSPQRNVSNNIKLTKGPSLKSNTEKQKLQRQITNNLSNKESRGDNDYQDYQSGHNPNIQSEEDLYNSNENSNSVSLPKIASKGQLDNRKNEDSNDKSIRYRS